VPEDRFKDEREFADLTLEKRGIKEREKEINKQLAELQERILDRWEEEGCRGVPFDDVTLGMRRGGFVKVIREGEDATPEEKAAVCQALKEAGYDEYVSEGFNYQSVTSLAKEERWDLHMPPELEGKLSFEPKFEISVRKKPTKTEDAPDELASSQKGG
jgi:hypothetical protein